jgi:hypothetical protein
MAAQAAQLVADVRGQTVARVFEQRAPAPDGRAECSGRNFVVCGRAQGDGSAAALARREERREQRRAQRGGCAKQSPAASCGKRLRLREAAALGRLWEAVFALG